MRRTQGNHFRTIKLRTLFVSDSVPKKAGAVVSILQSQLELASVNGWNADMFKKLKDALHREAAVLRTVGQPHPGH